MNGTILLPEAFTRKRYLSDRYHILFDEIASRLNWKIHVANDIEEKEIEGNILMALKCPQHDDPSRGANIPKLSKKIKVISYTVDLQSCSRDYVENVKKVLARSDLILCPYKHAFENRWPQYVDKFEWFPHYFAPTSRYQNMEFRKSPIPKCIVAGAAFRPYPIRVKAVNSKGRNIYRLPHPGYNPKMCVSEINRFKFKVGLDYAQELNKYSCALTCTSIYEYVLAKHLEIPAARTIMLTNRCTDLRDLGFIPSKHYVEVTEANVVGVIDDVVNHREKYTHIAWDAYKHVWEIGRVEVSAEQFVELLRTRKWL